MEKIFYTPVNTYPNSETAIKRVFERFFHLKNVDIFRNENGKPFLNATTAQNPLFFSVSHTNETLFIAVCDENVGIDAEIKNRQVAYASIVKKFNQEERASIHSPVHFLQYWTVKEATVKWLGGKLATDLAKLSYLNGEIFYQNLPLPVQITLLDFQNSILAVCSERDFSNAEFTPF